MQPGAELNTKACEQNFKRTQRSSAVATPALNSGGPRQTIELAVVPLELQKSILKYWTIPAKPLRIRFARWTRTASQRANITASQIKGRWIQLPKSLMNASIISASLCHSVVMTEDENIRLERGQWVGKGSYLQCLHHICMLLLPVIFIPRTYNNFNCFQKTWKRLKKLEKKLRKVQDLPQFTALKGFCS